MQFFNSSLHEIRKAFLHKIPFSSAYDRQILMTALFGPPGVTGPNLNHAVEDGNRAILLVIYNLVFSTFGTCSYKTDFRLTVAHPNTDSDPSDHAAILKFEVIDCQVQMY